MAKNDQNIAISYYRDVVCENVLCDKGICKVLVAYESQKQGSTRIKMNAIGLLYVAGNCGNPAFPEMTGVSSIP